VIGFIELGYAQGFGSAGAMNHMGNADQGFEQTGKIIDRT
jgi:hypothetical protein